MNIRIFLMACLMVSFACEDDERDTDFVASSGAPTNVSLVADVSSDNSGRVTLAPAASNAVEFTIDFGDGSGTSDAILPGATVEHVYAEGSYTLTVNAMSLNGEMASAQQDLVVAFAPPQNLTFEITVSETNVLEIEVDPSAENASGYEIYYGESSGETPDIIDDGDSATHIYGGAGTYEVRVVAFNGGVTTIEATQTVTIEDPGVVLPLDFEDTELDYDIIGFEGAESEIIDNEVSGGINTSSRVVRSIKTEGAQFFAGTVISLEAPVNFSETQSLAMKVYSPKNNIPIRLKLETANGGGEFVELDRNTTVINEWEELVWDFSGESNVGLPFVKIVVFFEFDPALPGDGSTYYFDDIRLAN